MKIIREDVNVAEDYMTKITNNFEDVKDTAAKYVIKLDHEQDVNEFIPLTKEAINSIDEILAKVEDILNKLEAER